MMPEITRANACDHRLPLLRIDKCDLCSGEFPKGTPFEVYGCDLHVECSLEHRRRKTKACSACLDRESVEFGVQRIVEEPRPVKPRLATKLKEDPATCQHQSPIAHVAYDRRQTPWEATVTVICGVCGLPFYVNYGPKAILRLTPPVHSASSVETSL
jgi:hypothetical protein